MVSKRSDVGQAQKQLTLIADLSRILAGGLPGIAGYAVRSVTPGDKQALAELYHASYSRDLVADMKTALEEMEQTFLGEFGVLDAEASLVVEEGEGLVGSILTVIEAPWPDTPPGPFIIDLFVHPTVRRHGLARYMIVEAAGRLARKGRRTVALRVLSGNAPALGLYDSLGFRRI
jgi:ribosomal protein S18 acetylase RimI-like enzyme